MIGAALSAAALRYARRAVAVFPCRGKIPLTARGVLDASTDVDVIVRWWVAHPQANVAIAAGASGLVILDVDTKHGVDGRASLAALEHEIGPLSATLSAITPSGGEHLYFRAPRDVEIRPSAGKLGPGLDVRGGPSYVVAPPSSIDGATYYWTARARPAELPPAWVAHLAPPPRETPQGSPPGGPLPSDSRVRNYCVRALQDEARSLASAPLGERNYATWNAAAALGGLVHCGGLDTSEIRRALEWAQSQWPARERDHRKDHDTLERGLAFGLSHPRRIEWSDDNG